MSEKEQMTLEEWNKRVDQYVAEENARAANAKPQAMIWEGQGASGISKVQRGIANKTVTADLIRYFAHSYGDMNPLWWNPDYAAKTKWGGVIAPPLFPMVIAYPSAQMPSLPGDELGRTDAFDGGITFENHGPIRPGDEFTGMTTYLGITEHKGKGSRMLISQTKCDYINQRGENVVSAIGKIIINCHAPSEGGAPVKAPDFSNVKIPHYSEETCQAIYDHYDDELAGKLARGSDPRYWEDVNEGDIIPPVLCGPLDEDDAMTFAAATMNMASPAAFACKWALMKEDLSSPLVRKDPQTGFLRVSDFHANDKIAKSMGYPGPLHFGGQSMSIIGHAITNWMGDDGFVTRMDFQNRRVSVFGDTNTATGKVVKKYEKDGEHFVDLELSGVTQDDVAHTVCKATVCLLSRGE